MYFDSEGLKKKVKSLSSDIEKGTLKAPEWLWVLAGGLIGLAASCLKTRETGKPIIAKFNKDKNNVEV